MKLLKHFFPLLIIWSAWGNRLSAQLCANSSLTLDSLVTVSTVAGPENHLYLTLCIGGGRTGTNFGAAGPTGFVFMFAVYGSPALYDSLIYFTPSVTSDTLGATYTGSNNAVACLNTEQINITYEDPLSANEYTCITSTAVCGNIHSDCKQYHFVWKTIVPDSIRAHGIEGLICGNGCLNSGMSARMGCSLMPPAPILVCEGNDVEFTGAAGGGNFQWQVSSNGGTSWTNLSNAGAYSGVNDDTLSITATTASLDGYLYRYHYNDLTCIDTSAYAMLEVDPAPSINSQPVAQTTCDSNSVAFSIVATPAISYQWQEDTGSGYVNLTNTPPYSGVTTTSLTISPATTALDQHLYRCLMLYNCGLVESDAALLSVNANPAATITQSNDTLFASGGVVYQWFFNGVLIQGANTSTYVPTATGNYTVQVTDANGCTSVSGSQSVMVSAGMPEINKNISVYPNPAAGHLWLNAQGSEGVFELLTLEGKVVLRKSISPGAGETRIELSDLANGLYGWRMWTGEEVAGSGRVVVGR